MQQILIGIILMLGFASYYFYSQNQILTANNAALEGAVATQEENNNCFGKMILLYKLQNYKT